VTSGAARPAWRHFVPFSAVEGDWEVLTGPTVQNATRNARSGAIKTELESFPKVGSRKSCTVTRTLPSRGEPESGCDREGMASAVER
jgi:hypothetical protein